MNEALLGQYATRFYLPLSALSRRWRGFSRRLRGKVNISELPKRLPRVSWNRATGSQPFGVWEGSKSHGDVRLSELAILSALAAECEDGTDLFEIGTFDGRTTFNLAMNSPGGCRVHTLDLPPDTATAFSIDVAERSLVQKARSGARYERNRARHPDALGKIRQLLGDSGTFDFSPWAGRCSLVFVDGSHTYDYLLSDTRAAMTMVRPGGVIVWHDYGVWDGVTTGLEELEARERYGLRNVRGTSLVVWRRASA